MTNTTIEALRELAAKWRDPKTAQGASILAAGTMHHAMKQCASELEAALAALSQGEGEAKPSLANPTDCARAMVLHATDRNAGSITFNLEGVTYGEDEIGDWTVTVSRAHHPEAQQPESRAITALKVTLFGVECYLPSSVAQAVEEACTREAQQPEAVAEPPSNEVWPPDGSVWLAPVATDAPANPNLMQYAWGRSSLSSGQMAEAYQCIVSAAQECGQVYRLPVASPEHPTTPTHDGGGDDSFLVTYSVNFMDGWLEDEGEEVKRNWARVREAALTPATPQGVRDGR